MLPSITIDCTPTAPAGVTVASRSARASAPSDHQCQRARTCNRKPKLIAGESLATSKCGETERPDRASFFRRFRFWRRRDDRRFRVRPVRASRHRRCLPACLRLLRVVVGGCCWRFVGRWQRRSHEDERIDRDCDREPNRRCELIARLRQNFLPRTACRFAARNSMRATIVGACPRTEISTCVSASAKNGS